MLNGAGRFKPEDPEEAAAAEALRATVAAAGQEEQESFGDKVKALLTKVDRFSFLFVKRSVSLILLKTEPPASECGPHPNPYPILTLRA